MLFSIGTRVKFLHTGDEGKVSGHLDGGMVMVYIEREDMEIPAFPGDLIRREEVGKTAERVKPAQGKKEQDKQPAPAPAKVETRHHALSHSGVHLAFEPVAGLEGLTSHYTLYLVNDSAHDLLYDISLHRNHKRPEKWDGRSASASFSRLGAMEYDDLNEAPSFEAGISWISTEGAGIPEKRTLNLKPRTFFASQRVAPFLDRPAHLLLLLEKPQARQPKETNPEDLYSYTRRHQKQASPPPLQSSRHLSRHETRELAEFPPELDLHIEKLTDNWRKMSNAEILRKQIAAFDAYLDKAIRLGVPRVFIIHGVGEGILRNSVATRLFGNPDVESFRNEYHPKYGWGATEILLK